MPAGGKSSDVPSGSNGQERPVVFQKYFKSGGRTYASQVKIASNSKRYLVLTEGVRDSETQEVKKHIIRVFESDLKEFFAMLQETVLYLRSTKDPGSSIAGVIAAKPSTPAQAAPVKASRPPVAPNPARPAATPLLRTQPGARPVPAKAPANGNGNGKTVPAARSARPVAPAATKPAKPSYRPAGRGR